jgi:hypothetical protein
MFLNKLPSVLIPRAHVLNWKYISNSLIICKVEPPALCKIGNILLIYLGGNFRDCHHFTSEFGHKKPPR